MIKVYTKNNCQQCNATKRRLEKRSIPFETINMNEDSSALEFVKSLGYLQAPIVYVNENRHWSGYRPDLIDRIETE